MKLPAYAEFQASAHQQHDSVVVLVPNFGGDRRSLLRHARMLNSIGYHCVTMDLRHNSPQKVSLAPFDSSMNFGLRHIWAEQIEVVLNGIPGDKFLFSFSFPSAAAIMAIQRRHSNDIAGWICDGGPFFDMMMCSWRLYTHAFKVKNPLLRAAAAAGSGVLLGVSGYKADITQALKDLPPDFPILSIRGWQDELVPVASIDKVFEKHRHLQFETLALPEAGHINGLMIAREEYTQRIKSFLSSHSRASEPKKNHDSAGAQSF